MKMWRALIALAFLCVCLPSSTYAFAVPAKPTSYVADFAGVLSAPDKSAIETKLNAFEKQTTNEIAVVIIPSLDGDTIENAAQEIFTKWGIGKKDKNNGALFLISIADRKTRIQTGYGLEGTLTDIGTSYIQSDIVRPAFRKGDYAGGIQGSVDKMISLIQGDSTVPADYTNQGAQNKTSFEDVGFLIFVIIMVLQWLGAILSRSKSWWAGGVLGGLGAIVVGLFNTIIIGVIAFVPLVVLGLLFDRFVSKTYEKYKGRRRMPWFIGGGGFGGGSSGGGFGGFGGGDSGGGGSSGDW